MNTSLNSITFGGTRSLLEAAVMARPGDDTARGALADHLYESGVYAEHAQARLYANAVALVAAFGRVRDAVSEAMCAAFRTERFEDTDRRHRVIPLTEVRHRLMHFAGGNRRVPCRPVDGRPCPLCSSKVWTRGEFVGPALVRDPVRGAWEPALVVFTSAGWSMFGEQHHVEQPADYVGRVLEVWREPRGKVQPMRIRVAESGGPRPFAAEILRPFAEASAAEGGAA